MALLKSLHNLKTLALMFNDNKFTTNSLHSFTELAASFQEDFVTKINFLMKNANFGNFLFVNFLSVFSNN